MKKLILHTALTLFAVTTVTVQAKEKHNQQDRVQSENSNQKQGRPRSTRTRTLFVIEHGRPVKRVVHIDSDGDYYRQIDGRRIYVQKPYYASYPSFLYTPSGKRRSHMKVPF